jgi:hypothetical protein
MLSGAAAFILLLLPPAAAQARSYAFLEKAIHEYDDNPSPENGANLNRAQTEAMVLDYAVIGVPIAILAAIRIAVASRRKKARA